MILVETKQQKLLKEKKSKILVQNLFLLEKNSFNS